jgi:type IV pilus assembly protein PilX
MKPHLRNQRQRGAILIIALIMLVLLTVLSVAGLRATTMDERVAGNARDKEKAMQSAETAVRRCLAELTADNPTYPTTKIIAQATAASRPNWEYESVWTASASSVSMPASAAVISAPQCLVEKLPGGSFRVTARAKGGSDGANVMLQATYSIE